LPILGIPWNGFVLLVVEQFKRLSLVGESFGNSFPKGAMSSTILAHWATTLN
jgi:hypothetical protein